ncbi:MAG: stage II sporulation protein M [Gammaproteobacteria bacterium]
MKQEQFIRRYEGDWKALQAWLDASADARGRSNEGGVTVDPGEVPALYRRVCHHLALARSRTYSPRLVDRLAQLAQDGHDRLYAERGWSPMRVVHFIARDLPRTVRAEWRLVALSGLVFWGTLLCMIAVLQFEPEFVHRVMTAANIAELEHQYDPAREREARDSAQGFVMFGFYVYNNAGIGFRTFASGVLFGIGTVFTLFYNGLVIGAAAGHLTQLGFIETFWGFVAGHSAFELTAIVLSGAAGMKLGFALLMPGRLRRMEALRVSAHRILPLVYGACLLFIMAAVIEAFWSPRQWVPVHLKYIVGIGLWMLTAWYFLRVGRGGRNGP